MSFLEIQFPKSISYGSTGGPGFFTTVRTLSSGFEKRNIAWSYPRHQYNVVYGVKTAEQLEELINFFNAVQGKGYGFRYNDPLDHKTCSYKVTPAFDDIILIASAAGGEITVQLEKYYNLGGNNVTRPIKKPISGTILIGKNGVQLTETTDYTIDYTTGIVTFTTALTSGDAITWGGEFDVPCRFDIDKLTINLTADIVGDTSIPVIEIKQ